MVAVTQQEMLDWSMKHEADDISSWFDQEKSTYQSSRLLLSSSKLYGMFTISSIALSVFQMLDTQRHQTFAISNTWDEMSTCPMS